MKIFEENKLYPFEKVPVLEHYKEYFDAVQICFLPFFQVETNDKTLSRKSREQITFEELKEKDRIFKKLDMLDAEIFASNEDYPEDKELLKSGNIINWKKIIEDTNLQSYREVNRALRTSIGAYKKPLRRFDLLNILETYSESNQVWLPIEGQFDVFTKIGIFKLLKRLNKSRIIVIEEFYENKKELNIEDLTMEEFIDQINFKDYYIYSEDKSILFAIDWDYFFYFIATKKENLEKINQIIEIEGITANKKDSHLWDWEEGEIDRLLNDANKSKKVTWWNRIFKNKN
jgi:Protein of unknown function (DUF2711)